METKTTLAKIFLVAVIVFIYLPLPFMVLLSFKSGASIGFPIQSFTLDWYIKPPTGYETIEYVSLFHDAAFFQALANSAVIAIGSGLLTALVVTLTALVLRYRMAGRNQVFYMILLGFVIPAVSLGIGIVFMFRFLGWQTSFWTPILVDSLYSIPFGLILLMSRFEPRLREYEISASVLKASPNRVIYRITLPLIMWEVVSAGLFGFVMAWNEVIRTQFVMRGTGVVSTYILTQLQVHAITPKWFAAGVLTSLISFTALFIFAKILSGRGTPSK